MKLQNQISAIKQEKTLLQQNLIGLQRRIGELELSIGGEHPNAEWEDLQSSRNLWGLQE